MPTRLPLAALLVGVSACAPAPAQDRPPVGVNLAAVVDYASELPFIDVMKMSRPWISQAEGREWGQGDPLDLDALGNIVRIRPGHFAEALICTDDCRQAPEGVYAASYEGIGELNAWQSSRLLDGRSGWARVAVKRGSGSISLRVMKTDPSDPLRNLKLLQPGYTAADEKEQLFARDFLSRTSNFAVLRFMDWQQTNNSPLVEWAERTTPKHATQARPQGVCLEYMIALCNRLDVDPWFCLPHKASDDFIRKFAGLVKEKLKPGRKVYVEYSNECWNGMFEQSKHCLEQGRKLGLSPQPWEAGVRYYAQRSVEIFQMFAEAFGGTERLVRVLASQSANPGVSTAILDWQSAATKADALALAPYFGGDFGQPEQAVKVRSWPVDQLLDGCAKSIEKNRPILKLQAGLAKKHNLQLLAYEGGQHLVGFQGAENSKELEKLFHAANRHPRMKDLYLQDLTQWQAEGGGLFCTFSSMGFYSKWGSWGLLETADQDIAAAPKYGAILEFTGKKR